MCEEGISLKEVMNKLERKNKSFEGEDFFFFFYLEVRFCKGFFYFFEFLMVVFYFIYELVLLLGCFNVILRLNREVKELCDVESFVVFCFVSFLEDEDEIFVCFNVLFFEYSLLLKKSIFIYFAKEYYSDFFIRKKAVDEKLEII